MKSTPGSLWVKQYVTNAVAYFVGVHDVEGKKSFVRFATGRQGGGGSSLRNETEPSPTETPNKSQNEADDAKDVESPVKISGQTRAARSLSTILVSRP